MLDVAIAVAGAGPVELCFAAAMSQAGYRVALLDRQAPRAPPNPQDDGREIALTMRSVCVLRELGVWKHLPSTSLAPLLGARVFNGNSSRTLDLKPPGTAPCSQLGCLVPNHGIHRAAFGLASSMDSLQGHTGYGVKSPEGRQNRTRITMQDSTQLTAQLTVAADSRFSETRKPMGIPAHLLDFGRSTLVCRMRFNTSAQRFR